MPSIPNQNSLLVEWQTDSYMPSGGGSVDREVRRLVPSSHERVNVDTKSSYIQIV